MTGGYTDDARMMRVDFFKPSGKWYMTEAVKMLSWDDELFDTLKRSIDSHQPGLRKHFICVILEPYHKHSHPVMLMPEVTE